MLSPPLYVLLQVVNVWKLSDSRGRASATLRQPLYGHTAPVLCLATSSAFNILVSGSRDKTCIIWDLSRLRYVTQLAGHNGPVAAIAINDLTGVIASCSSSWLYLWSVNGECLASVDTASNGTGPLQINCVCMSQANEWDTNNVIMTGSTDGVVRMYSVEMIRQSKTTKKSEDRLTVIEKPIGQSRSFDQSDLSTPSEKATLRVTMSEDYADLTGGSLTSPQSVESIDSNNSANPTAAIR